jgi:hypothetical protein
MRKLPFHIRLTGNNLFKLSFVVVILMAVPVTVLLVQRTRDDRTLAQPQREIPLLLEEKQSIVVLKFTNSTKTFSLHSKTSLHTTPEPKENLKVGRNDSYQVVVQDSSGQEVYETAVTVDLSREESYFDLNVPTSTGAKLVIYDQNGVESFEVGL